MKHFASLLLLALSFAALPLTGPASAQAPAFSPSLLTGKLLWLEADAGVYKDAAKTLPCTLSSDTAAVWADQSGNGFDATQTTAGSQPFYRPADLGGKPGLGFGGSQSLTLGNPAGLNLSALAGESVYLVARSTSANYGTILAKSSGGDSRLWFLYGSDGTHPNVFAHLGSPDTVPLSTPALIAYTYAQSVAVAGTTTAIEQLRTNGNWMAPRPNTAVPAWDTADAWAVGQNSAGSFPLTGQIYEILILDHAATEAENRAITSYLGTKWGIVAPNNIVFDGNSLTAGQGCSTGFGTTTGTCYPGQAVTLLSQPTWTTLNLGISGQSGQQLAYRMPTNALPHFNPLSPLNAYIFWEITNDLATAPQQSAAAAYADTVAACRAAKQVGFRVVALTMIPRGATAPLEASRQTANALLRADFSATSILFPSSSTPMLWANAPYADLLADEGSDPVVGLAGQSANTTNYQSDQTHMTDAGYHYPAYAVSRALALLAALPAVPPTPAPVAGTVPLSWPAVPGALSYNVYRDGSLLAAAPTPFYLDAQPGGAAHAYQVSAVGPLGETTKTTAITAGPSVVPLTVRLPSRGR